MDRHILYATLETIHGPHKVRVSAPLPWGAAVQLHERLHERATDQYGRPSGYRRPVHNPGYSVYGRPVRYLSVRSEDDPTWPREKPLLTLTDDHTGSRVF